MGFMRIDFIVYGDSERWVHRQREENPNEIIKRIVISGELWVINKKSKGGLFSHSKYSCPIKTNQTRRRHMNREYYIRPCIIRILFIDNLFSCFLVFI